MDFLNQPIIVFIVGGAAAGLVAWGSARVEIRFLWRDQMELRRNHRDLEKRVSFLERRSVSREVYHGSR